jgi:hypothetical protein
MNNKESNLDKSVAAIEKWGLIVIVLGVYLFLSFRIILSAFPEEPYECGTGLIAMVFTHLLFACIAAIITGIKLFRGKAFSTISKIIVFLIIAIPVIISFILF